MRHPTAFVLLAIFVLPALACAEEAFTAECPCPCPCCDSDWLALPDTTTAPPEFIWKGPILDLKRMVICQHGVFFKFSVRDKGRTTAWWFAYPEPTLELYSSCVSEDSLQSETSAIDRKVAVIGEAARKYQVFRKRLKEMLGERYKENRMIHFARAHGRQARLGLAFPLTFYWDNKEAEFIGMPELYYRK